MALLRRLGGRDAPEVAQVALADAPIFMLEVCTSALLAGLAAAAVPSIVLAFTVAAMVRTWLVLIGFGLPAGPADAALVLFSMGAVGLLPLSALGTAPTATVAAMGPPTCPPRRRRAW